MSATKKRNGTANARARLTEEQVRLIRHLHAEHGKSAHAICAEHPELPVSLDCVQRIINRSAWRHLP